MRAPASPSLRSPARFRVRPASLAGPGRPGRLVEVREVPEPAYPGLSSREQAFAFLSFALAAVGRAGFE